MLSRSSAGSLPRGMEPWSVIVPAVGTRVREFVQRRLRRLPILGSVYAIIAALGLVVLAVGVIGVAAVYTTNKHVRELEEVANRAFLPSTRTLSSMPW
jgi:hypothetical protein